MIVRLMGPGDRITVADLCDRGSSADCAGAALVPDIRDSVACNGSGCGAAQLLKYWIVNSATSRAA